MSDTVADASAVPEITVTTDVPVDVITRTAPVLQATPEVQTPVPQTVHVEGFPVTLSDFESVVKGTHNEVYLTLLRGSHRRERRTIAGWHRLITGYGDTPAH